MSDWIDRTDEELSAGMTRATNAAFGVLGGDFFQLTPRQMLLRLCDAVDAVSAVGRSDAAEVASRHPPGAKIHDLYLSADRAIADALCARIAAMDGPVVGSPGGNALLVFAGWVVAVEGLYRATDACRDATEMAVVTSNSAMLREICAKKFGDFE